MRLGGMMMIVYTVGGGDGGRIVDVEGNTRVLCIYFKVEGTEKSRAWVM